MSFSKLTEQQKRFCKIYIEQERTNASEAARRAGYSEKGVNVTASKLLANSNIRAYIEFMSKTAEEIFKDEVHDSLATLREIRDDKKAPTASRVRSAQDLLDRAGHGAEVKMSGTLKHSHSGSVASVESKEILIIQQTIGENEDVAEELLETLRKRNRAAQGESV